MILWTKKEKSRDPTLSPGDGAADVITHRNGYREASANNTSQGLPSLMPKCKITSLSESAEKNVEVNLGNSFLHCSSK